MNDILDELRESVRQVVEGAGLAATEQAIWPHVTELGWLLVSVPEALDGLGLGTQGAAVLHEELGRGLSSAPFLTAVMAIDAVCHSDLADNSAWAKRLTAGERITVPLVDPDLRIDRNVNGRTVLSGVVAAAQSADEAQHALMWSGSADVVALVSLRQPGVDVKHRATWDRTRRLFDVHLNSVAVDDEFVLATDRAARVLVRRLQALRDFGIAADSIGAAAAILDLTIEHLNTRRQFGRPLALFQALKHRCADLKMRLAAAAALLWDNLARSDDPIGSADATMLAAQAKYLACAAFTGVAEDALQLHGGVGMADEHPCHLFLKRAMLNEHLGTPGDRFEADSADSVIRAATG